VRDECLNRVQLAGERRMFVCTHSEQYNAQRHIADWGT